MPPAGSGAPALGEKAGSDPAEFFRIADARPGGPVWAGCVPAAAWLAGRPARAWWAGCFAGAGLGSL
jgi:hypothetical protein